MENWSPNSFRRSILAFIEGCSNKNPLSKRNLSLVKRISEGNFKGLRNKTTDTIRKAENKGCNSFRRY